MSDIALRMENVYKKFRRGEIYNSLRDLIPALTGRMFRGQELDDNDEREFWALQDISFEVKRGEALGVIGANGAGKSTALKILSRIMAPTKGRMVVNGRLSALIEVSAGFHPDLTGRENVFLNGTILGMTKREIQSKFDQIVEFSGLEEFIDTPVKRYSSGMYARLGFSVAAHVDPEVLIVDEVLSVGDYAFQRKCTERMKEVIRNGTTVLFVSHNLKTVREICHRCILLDKGRAIMSGQADEVISGYLNRPLSAQIEDPNSAVTISKVRIRDEYGDCLSFQSGQKAWIDIELKAHTPCHALAVGVYLKNPELQDVFGTTTASLGEGEFAFEEGQTFRCTFELNLNVVSGMYHAAALVYRPDIQSKCDSWECAATIWVGPSDGVRGIAHCFPKVVYRGVVAALLPEPHARFGV